VNAAHEKPVASCVWPVVSFADELQKNKVSRSRFGDIGVVSGALAESYVATLLDVAPIFLVCLATLVTPTLVVLVTGRHGNPSDLIAGSQQQFLWRRISRSGVE
jgi:hypothetical protein